jgi:hypothetical protein
MYSAAGLALRVAAAPIARSAAAGTKNADVAVVLTVRLPAIRGALSEAVTVVRTLYDAEGRASTPVQEKKELIVQSTTGDELRYDLYQRLTLAPGRYTVRLNATSKAIGRSGSVYADIEVPDFSRRPLSASSIVLGTPADPAAPRTDVLAAVVPVLPTSAREFSPNESVVAFLRVFQGGTTPIAPVTVTTKVLDISDTQLFEKSSTIAIDAFDASRSAPFEIALPLSSLSHGPHLLSISVAAPGASNVRKDLVFRVR